ncbi:L,D-transpeptidase family protein [Flavobacterium pedocola]
MKTITQFFLVMMLFTFGCNDKKATPLKPSIYTDKNYSDLLLDEALISAYFKANPESEPIKNEVYEFYRNRDFQYAWFNKEGMTQAVPNFYSQLENYSINFKDTSFTNPQLDTLITLIKTDKTSSNRHEKSKERLELLLTTTFFKYSKKVYSGVAEDLHQLDWFIPRNKKNFQVLLDSLVLSDKSHTAYEPFNQYYLKLKEQLREYRNIQKNGGFPKIETTEKLLSVTDKDSCLAGVKQLLFLTGDLRSNDKTIVFTDSLALAVTRFQQRLGLPENGKIDPKTLIELKQPIDFRIKQIIINLERLRWIPVEFEDNYLLVNIPEFKLHVFENKKLIWTTNVVVGKEANRTSIFKGALSQIVLNPYWNIPKSIIREEILPKLKQDASYLSKNNMEVLSGNQVVNPLKIKWNTYKENIPFEIRQKPGINNSLGKIKFVFPNSFSIYLHDTPEKKLFNATERDFSHGCIRVENPKKLALYLLRNDKNWQLVQVNKVLAINDTHEIQVNPTIPVYITYFTAWVDDKGRLNFRNDIYSLDAQLEKEVFGNEQ